MVFEDFVEEWLTVRGNEVLSGCRRSRASDKYSMNYQNIWDWFKLRDQLPSNMSRDLDLIWRGITSYPGESGVRNSNAWGMKSLTDLTPWLLLLAGCEWEGLKSWNASPIAGNVMLERGIYSPKFGVCKILSPRSARRESRRWFNSHEGMLDAVDHENVYTFVVNMGGEKYLDSKGRESVGAFWSGVTERLRCRAARELWNGYFYSHEVAPKSISSNRVFPHTHVVVWTGQKKLKQEDLDELFRGEGGVNLHHKNMRGDSEGFKRHVEYLHAIPAWSTVYRDEWSPETSATLNTELPNHLQAVLDLYWGRRKTGTIDHCKIRRKTELTHANTLS